MHALCPAIRRLTEEQAATRRLGECPAVGAGLGAPPPCRPLARYDAVRLVSEFGAVVLRGPPRGLDAGPPDKALVCVSGLGEYEAPGYILSGAESAIWTGAADEDVRTWLLVDRGTAPLRTARADRPQEPGPRSAPLRTARTDRCHESGPDRARPDGRTPPSAQRDQGPRGRYWSEQAHWASGAARRQGAGPAVRRQTHRRERRLAHRIRREVAGAHEGPACSAGGGSGRSLWPTAVGRPGPPPAPGSGRDEARLPGAPQRTKRPKRNSPSIRCLIVLPGLE